MKKSFLYFACVVMLATACSQDDLTLEKISTENDYLSEGSGSQSKIAISGVAYVKVPRESAAEMVSVMKNGITRASANSKLSSNLLKINTSNLEPLFPIDPRYEKRMRKAGLDRWFIVRFDENQDLDETLETLKASECFEYVEKSYLTSLPDATPIAIQSARGLKLSGDEEYPFNDELLPGQWHYKNYGNTPNSAAGADINLFEAWETQTGTNNVTVAVIDGGVDVEHEDLVDNIWTNSGEIPNDNIDNDGNGYVDDVNGYNFIDNTGKITWRASSGHATHVAGIIAARNGNGIGVCGIAGGDTTHSGARIMSCEKFNNYGQGISGEEAFVYAANNGAVITQNSWGYTYPGVSELPESMKEAIDYFIDYAGCDNDGNQLPDSPMKGGIAIFAAGNDGKDYVCYPGAYDRVVAVSGMAPDWTVAFYSNRGEWVDIMAPGGDLRSMYGSNVGQILSTLPPDLYNGVGYGYMQGTSMACPHVSGIAALIVSQFGGQGFTNDECRKRLEGALRPENIDEHNPDYIGTLGVGYIDAGKVFATNGGKNPENITDLTAEADYSSIDLAWTAVADEDDTAPVKYHIYVSTSTIDEDNLGEISYTRVNATGIQPGTSIKYTLTNLEDNTTYYLGIVAVDRWGQTSDNPQFITATTKENHAPTVTGMPAEPIIISGTQKKSVSLTISDEDGHQCRYRLSGDTRGVTSTYKDPIITLDFRANSSPGQYTVTVIVTDELGAETTVDIQYEISEPAAPVLTAEIPEQVLKANGMVDSLNLSQYFTFEEGTTFSAVSSNEKAVTSSVIGSSLLLTSGQVGESFVTIEADYCGKITETTFAVYVNESGEIPEGIIRRIYPQPAVRYLNIVLASNVKEATASIRSLYGERLYHKKHAITDGTLTLDVQKFSAGTYTLIIESEQGTSKKTFIKQ